MKKKFLSILPKYTWVPLIFLMLMNTFTYNGSKLLTNHFYHYNTETFIDEMIPFVPFFILFYILAYVQWIVGYIVIARENKKICYQYLSAELIAKSLCLFFFIVFPTTMHRPVITGNGFFLFLTQFIYRMDAPVNLFPSIHCLESWMCFRGFIPLKKVSVWYKIIMFLFTVCVCLSTVCVKQHVFIDIIGGIMVVEVGLWISRRFHTERFFEKLEKKNK